MTFKMPSFEEQEGYNRDPFRPFFNSDEYQRPYEIPLIAFPKAD